MLLGVTVFVGVTVGVGVGVTDVLLGVGVGVGVVPGALLNVRLIDEPETNLVDAACIICSERVTFNWKKLPSTA